jgi:hypothetical protein
MDQSYFRKQADRCRRLARDSTVPVLQVTLRRLADEYQMIADELEDEEVSTNPVALNVAVPGDQHECRQHDPNADCPNCKRVESGLSGFRQ